MELNFNFTISKNIFHGSLFLTIYSQNRSFLIRM